MRDCNTFRGLVSNGNETDIERFRNSARNWEPRFFYFFQNVFFWGNFAI